MKLMLRFLFLLIMTLSLTLVGPLLAQGGGGGGGGQGGGGGRPGGEESTTNLSYPAYFFGNSLQTGEIGSSTLDGAFPAAMSYGCLSPETIGTTTYPNTSCVTAEGVPQDYDTCVARCAALNPPVLEVERIYPQKNVNNKWQAGYAASGSTKLAAEYIDWGDNLEGRTWPVQVLRVETNTFSTLPAFVEGTLLASNPRTRFDLWHVFGQGTNELWGLHTTNPDPSGTDPVAPYLYLDLSGNVNWPYAVNVAAGARLNVAKLHTGTAVCPATATGVTQSPYKDGTNLSWFFNTTSQTGYWVDAPYYTDMVYGSELNIKGSYVYGYNWNLRSQAVPPDVNKAGWWRLTFYTPDGSIDFANWAEPTSAVNTLAPPVDPAAPGTMAPAAETSLLLYVPQVDKVNQLTYLDICISGGKAGGGGKGGGGGGGPR